MTLLAANIFREKQMWSSGAKTVTGENESTRTQTFPNATLPTKKNPTTLDWD